jgi:hypothetical protein
LVIPRASKIFGAASFASDTGRLYDALVFFAQLLLALAVGDYAFGS